MSKRTRHPIKRPKLPPSGLAQKIAIVQTGIKYKSIEIALLVPETFRLPPAEIVKDFQRDTIEMHRRAMLGYEVTLDDVYQQTFMLQAEMENGHPLASKKPN